MSPEPPTSKPIIPVIEDLIFSNEYISAICKKDWLRRALHLTPDKIIDVAVQTSGQRDNPMWAVVRKHRITASNFGPILSAIEKQL